jgi:hypothetical protein
MPQWHDAPQSTLSSALSEVWKDLNLETANGPEFEEVTGLSMQDFAEHAVEAIAAYFKRGERDPTNPMTYVHLYAMGFVIGCKYGAQQQPGSQTDNTT